MVTLGGVTLFLWKRGHAPPPPAIHAEAPVADAAAPTDAGQLDAAPDAAKLAAMPEVRLSPECAALRKSNEEAIRRYEKREKPHCLVEPPDANCVTLPNGVTWGYRIARIHTEPEAADAGREKYPCEREFDLEIVRQDRTGTQVVRQAKRDTMRYDRYTKQNMLSLDGLTDYDGDGEIEILRTHDEYNAEGGEGHEATILAFKGGNLTPYPPAADLIFDGLEDIDGDGRIDLLSCGPYHVGTLVHSDVNTDVSGLFAYHSLSDGTFALDDDVAIAYTRKHCPSSPKAISLTLEGVNHGSSNLAEQLVCARLWGVSPQKIDQAWDAVCKDFDAAEDPFACQTWPKDLAAITPPFELR